jgi:hypothetical protein
MTIRLNPDDENAEFWILINREFDSNVISSSDSHDEKQEPPRISTDRGISIRFNPDDENADFSILIKHEFDSNVISSSD